MHQTLLLAGGLLLATSAFAQKEQWLRYSTSPEGKSYEYIELTTNPPPDLKLPSLNAPPYFARWLTPLDPSGGRWLCFDRSRKSGPYDRLYVDARGDGKLGATPIPTARVDEYSAVFQPVKMTFKGEDGPIAYHLILRFMKYDTQPARLLSSSGGYYAGDVDLGNGKKRLELIDNNVNATFNDCGASPGESDNIRIADDFRFLGKMVEFDGVFYRVEVARDGAFVKIQKAEDVALGKVKVPGSLSQFSAFGPNGHFTRKPQKGEFTLPVGSYAVQDWTIKRKDKNGSEWEMSASRDKEASNFEVAAGQAAQPTAGEPVRMELKADEATNQVVFRLSFVGPGGESVQLMKGRERPPGPKLILASLDGSYRSTNTFEFG